MAWVGRWYNLVDAHQPSKQNVYQQLLTKLDKGSIRNRYGCLFSGTPFLNFLDRLPKCWNLCVAEVLVLLLTPISAQCTNNFSTRNLARNVLDYIIIHQSKNIYYNICLFIVLVNSAKCHYRLCMLLKFFPIHTTHYTVIMSMIHNFFAHTYKFQFYSYQITIFY